LDFGYQYSGLYTISGTVFYDAGNNGSIYSPGAGDSPFEGITVYLRNSSGLLIGTATTSSSGYYEFTGLPNGDYTIAVGEIPDLVDQTMTYEPDEADDDNYCGTGLNNCNNNVTPVTIFNANVINQDFGYYGDPPTAITLSSFEAEWDGNKVLVIWETVLEINTVGFNLWRSTSAGGSYVRVNGALISAESLGGAEGGSYEIADAGVAPGTVYYYKLEEVEAGGARNWHGPVSTGGSDPTSLTLVAITANARVLAVWWWGAVAVIGLPLAALTRLRRRRR
jgi:hypothetical protein